MSLPGLLALAFAVSAQADCAFPAAPDTIPDGKTASEAEMVAAMKAFKDYDGQVNAYVSCLDQETKTKSEGAAASQIMQIKSMQSKKQNAAVGELQAKAAKFNEQVRVFKSRNG
jgi:hypothetical protein